jgi:hypothetical protein
VEVELSGAEVERGAIRERLRVALSLLKRRALKGEGDRVRARELIIFGDSIPAPTTAVRDPSERALDPSPWPAYTYIRQLRRGVIDHLPVYAQGVEVLTWWK